MMCRGRRSLQFCKHPYENAPKWGLFCGAARGTLNHHFAALRSAKYQAAFRFAEFQACQGGLKKGSRTLGSISNKKPTPIRGWVSCLARHGGARFPTAARSGQGSPQKAKFQAADGTLQGFSSSRTSRAQKSPHRGGSAIEQYKNQNTYQQEKDEELQKFLVLFS